LLQGSLRLLSGRRFNWQIGPVCNSFCIERRCESVFALVRHAGDNTGMEEYGERLRARARELGLTDAEVARRLGLAQSRYANYVNGNREPDLATFARICRVLATTPDEILGFNSNGGAEPERRRALAAIEAMDQPALRLAAVLLEAIAVRQSEL